MQADIVQNISPLVDFLYVEAGVTDSDNFSTK